MRRAHRRAGLRLAPVTAHRALAHVRRALDGAWRLLAWDEGAVTVEADGAERLAARVDALVGESDGVLGDAGTRDGEGVGRQARRLASRRRESASVT